jgi:hypothetical protein
VANADFTPRPRLFFTPPGPPRLPQKTVSHNSPLQRNEKRRDYEIDKLDLYHSGGVVTDLCGVRSAMVVPTATVDLWGIRLTGRLHSRELIGRGKQIAYPPNTMIHVRKIVLRC